ncbi:MAG: hypothetical protein ACYSUY_07455 [Planctomycetota bacterium]|jgi:hypothetical protein
MSEEERKMQRAYKWEKIVRHGRLIFVIAIIWVCLVLWVLLTGPGPNDDRASEVNKCQINLRMIGHSMFVYAIDHDNEYPTAEKWCDMLVKHSEAAHKNFICPSSGAKEGVSNYAFNKNLIGMKCTEVPRNVVVLFETKAGWNQFGGPELMNLNNHELNGCNVMFNNIRIEFIKPEELGNLQWKPDEAQQE